MAKKNKYAEIIRAEIVDPGSADLLKKEAQAAKLARKTKVRDNAAARLKNCKSTLKSMQANMVRFAELASRTEASAGLAADRVSKKSSKKTLSRQQDTMSKRRTMSERSRIWSTHIWRIPERLFWLWSRPTTISPIKVLSRNHDDLIKREKELWG